MEGVSAHSRGLELDDEEGHFQPKPFYDSMIENNMKNKLCYQIREDFHSAFAEDGYIKLHKPC